jgi:hypothetical protein
MSCQCDCHGNVDCGDMGTQFIRDAQQRRIDSHILERALYEAQLTSYPYATAEASRLLRTLQDKGFTVSLHL